MLHAALDRANGCADGRGIHDDADGIGKGGRAQVRVSRRRIAKSGERFDQGGVEEGGLAVAESNANGKTGREGLSA